MEYSQCRCVWALRSLISSAVFGSAVSIIDCSIYTQSQDEERGSEGGMEWLTRKAMLGHYLFLCRY